MIDLYNGDCLEVMDKLIADGVVVDAIITDPPYNIGISKEWDKFNSDDEYINFIGSAISKSEKLLKENGAMFLFHNDFEKMVQIQNYINNNCNLYFRQMIVWDKFNGGKSGDKGRVEKGILNFPKQAEYILFYSKLKGNEPFGNDFIREYIKNERKKIKASLTEINRVAFNDKSGKDGMAGNILSSYKKGWSFPTKEKYEKLKKVYNIFDIEYEELKSKITNSKPHTYNCQNVASIIQFPPEPKTEHLTPKPIKLMELLVKTITNENELVLDFTMGSGTTGVACKNLNRNFIGIELDGKYFTIAKDRINKPKDTLF